MEKYDYFEAVVKDVKEYIRDNDYDLTEWRAEEDLKDRLFTEDSVTGNGDGSHRSRWECEEFLCHNMDLLEEACWALGNDFGEQVKRGAQSCDSMIRCYLLDGAVSHAIKEMEEDSEYYA